MARLKVLSLELDEKYDTFVWRPRRLGVLPQPNHNNLEK